jgi:hypothetical protein
LLLYYVHCPAREEASKQREVLVNRKRFSEQPVERDNGGDGGKEREQSVEYDACGYRKQAILCNLRVGTPEDILPSCPRDTPGGSGLAAPPSLTCSLMLEMTRLICAACRAVCTTCRPTGILRVPRGCYPLRLLMALPITVLPSCGEGSDCSVPQEGQN